jgi:hypothetical protein
LPRSVFDAIDTFTESASFCRCFSPRVLLLFVRFYGDEPLLIFFAITTAFRLLIAFAIFIFRAALISTLSPAMPLPLAASAIIFDFDTLMLCHYFID